MAIIENGKTMYEGQVIGEYDHMWSDGMLEEYAVVWDMEVHDTRDIQVGYSGADGRNLMGDISYKIDYTEAVVQDVIETMRKRGLYAFERETERMKHTVLRGDRVRVIRGRKIPKGTELTVFWIGDRPDYTGYRTETIAGCKTDNGDKVWIKYDYLETLETRPDPTEDERKDFVRDYVKDNVRKTFQGRVELNFD